MSSCLVAVSENVQKIVPAPFGLVGVVAMIHGPRQLVQQEGDKD